MKNDEMVLMRWSQFLQVIKIFLANAHSLEHTGEFYYAWAKIS